VWNYVLAKSDDPEDLLGRDMRGHFCCFCLAGPLVLRRTGKSSLLSGLTFAASISSETATGIGLPALFLDKVACKSFQGLPA
jgi:hypothetical protein